MDAPFLSDTTSDAESVLIAGYRSMSASQKIELVCQLTRAVQEMALLDVRRRYPHADEREQALRVASRWIDPEIMKRAFGWDARESGF